MLSPFFLSPSVPMLALLVGRLPVLHSSPTDIAGLPVALCVSVAAPLQRLKRQNGGGGWVCALKYLQHKLLQCRTHSPSRSLSAPQAGPHTMTIGHTRVDEKARWHRHRLKRTRETHCVCRHRILPNAPKILAMSRPGLSTDAALLGSPGRGGRYGHIFPTIFGVHTRRSQANEPDFVLQYTRRHGRTRITDHRKMHARRAVTTTRRAVHEPVAMDARRGRDPGRV